jgi:hypothetical protein
MTDKSESGEDPDNPPKSIETPRPKRGAFPTPKSELEKAKPYVPDLDEDEKCDAPPELPRDVGGKTDR